MKTLLTVLTVAGIILGIHFASQKRTDRPRRPPVAATLDARTVEEKLLGVSGSQRVYADVSGSGDGTHAAENNARWRDVAAYLYFFVLDSLPGSVTELFASSGVPGRPELLARYEVPKGEAKRQRLAERLLAEVPQLLAGAMERCRGVQGSPILEDTRALFGRTAAHERSVLVVQSDFEQQSGYFPSMEFAGGKAGWARAERLLGKPQCAPERVIAVHVQTKSGQLAGRVDALIAVFQRYAQHWGAREVLAAEVTGR